MNEYKYLTINWWRGGFNLKTMLCATCHCSFAFFFFVSENTVICYINKSLLLFLKRRLHHRVSLWHSPPLQATVTVDQWSSDQGSYDLTHSCTNSPRLTSELSRQWKRKMKKPCENKKNPPKNKRDEKINKRRTSVYSEDISSLISNKIIFNLIS